MNGYYENWRIYNHRPCIAKTLKEYENLNIKKCDFEIIERIGSEGTMSVVYNVNIDGYNFALKILPIVDKYSIETNEEEIMFAKIMSDNVRDGDCDYFPVVIDSGYCHHFEYADQNDTWRKLSKEYMESISNYKDTPINYLISELGTMDLYNWIDYYYKEKKLYYFIWNVLQGIKCLQENNIYHGDLHLYNILIIKRNNCGEIACIHDFGRSRYILSDNDYLLDYKFFIRTLHDKIKTKLIKEMHNSINTDWDSIKNKREFIGYIITKYFT